MWFMTHLSQCCLFCLTNLLTTQTYKDLHSCVWSLFGPIFHFWTVMNQNKNQKSEQHYCTRDRIVIISIHWDTQDSLSSIHHVTHTHTFFEEMTPIYRRNICAQILSNCSSVIFLSVDVLQPCWTVSVSLETPDCRSRSNKIFTSFFCGSTYDIWKLCRFYQSIPVVWKRYK